LPPINQIRAAKTIGPDCFHQMSSTMQRIKLAFLTTLLLLASASLVRAQNSDARESSKKVATADAASVAGGQANSIETPIAKKSALKILFVGNSPDLVRSAPSYLTGKAAARYKSLKQERTPAFKSFLESHFQKVTIMTPSNYDVEISKQYDVTVFDALPPAIKQIDMGNWEKRIRMPYEFDRPTVMIGNVGPLTLGRNGLGLRLDHL
jgi:hypothetical protein